MDNLRDLASPAISRTSRTFAVLALSSLALIHMTACSVEEPLDAGCPQGFAVDGGVCKYSGPVMTAQGRVTDHQSKKAVSDALVQAVDPATAKPLPLHAYSASKGDYRIAGVPADIPLGFLVRASGTRDTYKMDVSAGTRKVDLGSMSDLTFKLLAAYVGAKTPEGADLFLGTAFDAAEKPLAVPNAAIRLGNLSADYFGDDDKPDDVGARDRLNPKNGQYYRFGVPAGTTRLSLHIAGTEVTSATVGHPGNAVIIMGLRMPPTASSQ
jgi:hypothetical protein